MIQMVTTKISFRRCPECGKRITRRFFMYIGRGLKYVDYAYNECPRCGNSWDAVYGD